MEFAKPGVLTLLRDLNESDLESLSSLPPYESVIFERCRLPFRSLNEWKKWFSQRNGKPGMERVAALNTDGDVVGLIVLEPIQADRSSRKTFRLHLEIGSSHARRGYGFDGLTTFLDNLFSLPSPPELIEVKIPAFHSIANRFLNSLSFQMNEKVWDIEPLGQTIFQINELRSFMRFFQVTGNQTEVTCFIHRLTRIHWNCKRDFLLAKREEKALRKTVTV